MQITAFKAIFLARRINILGCEDNEITFAQMESDCTWRFGFTLNLLKRFEVLKKCRDKFDCFDKT